MIVYLIRHGRQNSSDCNVNVPLAETGEQQAKLLGKRFQNYPVDALYCSDLIRAEQTARIAFADRPELIEQLQIRPALAEMDFGALTGRPDPEVKQFYQDYYEAQKKAFGQSFQKERQTTVPAAVEEYFIPVEEMSYPAGENGERVLDRLLPVLQEWIDSGKKHIAVVCHGGVIRVLLSALFGGNLARRLQFGTSLENCSITQIHYDETLHGFYLDRFNDYAHLEGHPELMRGIWKQ